MTDLHTAAKQDIPDLIAGALGVSRGTAYDLMRDALVEQPAPVQQEPAWRTAGGIPRFKPAQQEPVAWQHRKPIMDSQGNTRGYSDWLPGKGLEWWPHRRLYTSPPAQRKPLTNEQFQDICNRLSRQGGWDGDGWDLALKEAIEAAHGIGEKK